MTFIERHRHRITGRSQFVNERPIGPIHVHSLRIAAGWKPSAALSATISSRRRSSPAPPG
jgi:hypothetical protein